MLMIMRIFDRKTEILLIKKMKKVNYFVEAWIRVYF
jgi:hypothetical protein